MKTFEGKFADGSRIEVPAENGYEAKVLIGDLAVEHEINSRLTSVTEIEHTEVAPPQKRRKTA